MVDFDRLWTLVHAQPVENFRWTGLRVVNGEWVMVGRTTKGHELGGGVIVSTPVPQDLLERAQIEQA